MALLVACCPGHAHAHRTQKDLPSSQNGQCSSTVGCDGTAYYIYSYTPLLLNTSQTSGLAAQVTVGRFGQYGPTTNYPCSSTTCTIGSPETWIEVQLQDGSGTPLSQSSGIYLVAIAVNAVAQNTTSDGPGFFVTSDSVSIASASSTGLSTEDGSTGCLSGFPVCEVFAAQTITSVDGGNITYWPIGSNGANTTVGITNTTLTIPGFPDLSNPPSDASFGSSTLLNNLTPASATSFAILVYDSNLNDGAGGVVTLGSLALSQPTNSRSLTGTLNLNQQTLPYQEVVNALGGVSPATFSTIDLGVTSAAPSCQTNGSFSGVLNRVVEYSYTPPSTQTATIDTSGSLYDTVIVVTTEGGTPVACNDDYTDAAGNTYSQAQIPSVTLNGGTTYLIQVGEYPSSVLYPIDSDGNSPPSDPTTNPCFDGSGNPGSCPAINIEPILHFSFSVPAAISFSSTSVTLSNVIVGSPAQTSVTVTNTGGDPLTISSVVSSDPAFTVANGCTTSVAAQDNCVLGITFSPSSAGTINATLTVTDNASPTTQVIQLTGSGIQPAVSLSATQVSFPAQVVGTTSNAASLVITNSGTAPLHVTGTIVSAPAFTVTNGCTAPVAPQSTCTLGITFSPSSAGTINATLTVTDDASPNTQVIQLTGSGTQPAVSLSATQVSFPAQLVGTTSSATTLTITNSGTAPLHVTGISASAGFATSGCTAAINSSSNCQISITFTPAASGTVTGTLSITDDAANSPQNISLSGQATDFSLTAASGASLSQTVDAGQTASYSLSLSPLNGLTGAVSLACGTLPTGVTCDLTPASATLSGSPTAVDLSLVTTSATTARTVTPGYAGKVFAVALLCLPFAGRRRRRALLCFVLLAVCAAGIACGGGSNNSNPPPNPNATPPGTYTVPVNATLSGQTRSVSVTLVVE